MLAPVSCNPARVAMGTGDLRTDVDAIVIPIATGHVLVDVGVDARHLG